MLLALFLIDLAAGLVVFLPLVGRRNAGVKFYRMVFLISAALAACAAATHALAGARALATVDAALCAIGVWNEIAIRQGIFFWMRGGWGLIGPLLLYPMVWGTVRLRSTMAATGILYVDVVAVVIGEVLGGWLSAIAHVPV